MSIRHVALIGGSGFVGRHIAAHLHGLGYRCRIVTRNPERHRSLRPVAEVVQADPFNDTELTDVLHGQDAVVNLVGILNPSSPEDGFRRAHVDLVDHIVTACRAAHVGRLLHMSALNADATLGASEYLRTKGEGEHRAHSLGRPDIAVTSFRPSVIFGPDDSFINRFATLLRLPGPLPLACPDALLAPIFVGNVADAFARSLEDHKTFGQHYELCGPRVYTLAELVRTIAELTGIRATVVGLPDWASRLQARMLQYAPGKPFTPDNYLSLSTPSECRHDGLGDLGIEAISLENAASRFLDGNIRTRRFQQLRRHSGRDD